MTYGFVGLGHLGGQLRALLLRAGFALVVCDLDRQAAAPLVAAGARFVATPAETAAQCEVVITCLPSPAASARALDGILEGARPGLVWIEMSTNDRDSILALADKAARRGAATLECPVTGGVHLAASGDITVIVGGDVELFERCRPALSAMGRR